MMYYICMNDVLSNAEITAELAAEANPLPDALRCVTPSPEKEETCECQRCGEQWDASPFAKGEVVDGKVDECGECWREELTPSWDEDARLDGDYR